jgi:aminopeptidase YwaD
MITANKRIHVFCLCTLLSLPVYLNAQLPARVNGEHIKKIISEIASDEYQGRATGTQGCIKAEEYFANAYKKLKLLPMGDSGTFFYHYTITDDDFEFNPTLVVDERVFYYGYNEDFTVFNGSDRGEAEAEIIFAGYGIVNPDKNRNDFDSLDILNKIVLMKRGAPGNDIAGWRPSCIDSVKAAYCFQHGALGVLFFEPSPRYNPQVLLPNYNNHLAINVIPGFPVFSVDERVARYILAKSGQFYYRLMSNLENEVVSFNTGRKGAMSVRPNSRPVIKARNVLAMLPGTDRKLKDEYILIGGHIDHVGMDDAGNIRNGADDNASGPSVALGIAQAMVENGFKPKRSIVFIGWTGEEMGLLGSRAWCEKPNIDLKKIAVYFNLDMVGLGNGGLNMPGTEFAPEVYQFIQNHTDTTVLKKITWSKGGLGGSDHNYFLMKGVPAFAGMTSGSHPDYHQTGDDPEKIQADILQFTGDFIYNSAALIANAKESFLSVEQMDENKFKLLTYNILSPIASGNYRKELESKSYRLGFVDFSDAASSAVPAENFMSLLNAYTLAGTPQKPKENFILAKSAYEAMVSRAGLLAVFDADLIRWDELMFKVLARYGYRLTGINNNSGVLKDTAVLRKSIRLAAETGVGLILNNLNAASLDQVISLAIDPCIILNSDASLITDSLRKRIVTMEHLVVFQPRPGSNVEAEYENFLQLMKMVGKDHVTIAPVDLTENGYSAFKLFMKEFMIHYPSRDFQSKILTGNMQNFAARSLQPL